MAKKYDINALIEEQKKLIESGVAREFKFIVPGRPRSQKNDLQIYWKRVGGVKRPFVAHSADLHKFRNDISNLVFGQYLDQGGKEPINWLFKADFVFYCSKRWEPDLDNMPAVIMDAMQGIKKGKTIIVSQTVANDKLLRYMTARKIVQYDPQFNGELRTELTISPFLIEE